MQKVPEDARGIGIQISRLEILKNKSRNATLTNFLQNKPSNTVHHSVEANKSNKVQSQFDLNLNAVASASENINNEEKLDIPPDINESVLREIPKEIQNEILNANQSKKLVDSNQGQTIVDVVVQTNRKESLPVKNVQTRQEHFFKQTKSGISRPTKVEMPPIQEIDMSVLIELPEDIRNEILNEYSAKKREEKINVNRDNNSCSTSSASKEKSTAKIDRDEENISYSQVDPEFLAALSDDLRRDVQIYCSVRNEEHSRKKRNETNRDTALTRKEDIKHGKQIEHNAKNKNGAKNSKTISKSKKKNIQTTSKTVKTASECDNMSNNKADVGIARFIPCTGKIESVNNEITPDEAEAILSHNFTISQDNDIVNQHQDILIDLVNRLLNLPLEQVVFIILTDIDVYR